MTARGAVVNVGLVRGIGRHPSIKSAWLPTAAAPMSQPFLRSSILLESQRRHR
jgi:hypothetical protein